MARRRLDSRDRALLLIAVAFLVSSLLMVVSVGVQDVAEVTDPAVGEQASDEPLEPSAESDESDSEDEPEPEPPRTTCFAMNALSTVLDSGAYQHAIDRYALSRVVLLDYEVREPQLFGPWPARDDFDAEEASDIGELTQWEPGYYITHDWSDYGKQILLLIPGDQVIINDRTMQVDNMFDYPKDAYLREISALVGYETVVLQTCEPNYDDNRIVYGHWLES